MMRIFQVVAGLLLVVFAVAGAGVYSALAQEDDCVGRAECYSEPSTSPSSSGGSDESSGGGDDGSSGEPGQWEGTVDGRLNPEPDEDFSVWCTGNEVQVWASAFEIAGPVFTLSIRALIDMEPGIPFFGPGFDVVKFASDDDTISITGSPSNNGGIGFKTFSLAACVASNGGEPPADDGAAVVVSAPYGEAVEEEEQQRAQQAARDLDERLRAEEEADRQRSLEIAWRNLIGTCFPWAAGIVLLPGAFSSWRRRWRRRKPR